MRASELTSFSRPLLYTILAMLLQGPGPAVLPGAAPRANQQPHRRAGVKPNIFGSQGRSVLMPFQIRRAPREGTATVSIITSTHPFTLHCHCRRCGAAGRADGRGQVSGARHKCSNCAVLAFFFFLGERCGGARRHPRAGHQGTVRRIDCTAVDSPRREAFRTAPAPLRVSAAYASSAAAAPARPECDDITICDYHITVGLRVRRLLPCLRTCRSASAVTSLGAGSWWRLRMSTDVLHRNKYNFNAWMSAPDSPLRVAVRDADHAFAFTGKPRRPGTHSAPDSTRHHGTGARVRDRQRHWVCGEIANMHAHSAQLHQDGLCWQFRAAVHHPLRHVQHPPPWP